MKHFSVFPLSLMLFISLITNSCENQRDPVSPKNGALNNTTEVQAELAKTRGKIVFVASPSGNVLADRAIIKAAVAQAEPGDIVQFASGTYLIGTGVPYSYDGIVVDVPNTILQGHPGGTTLKGGDNIKYFGI